MQRLTKHRNILFCLSIFVYIALFYLIFHFYGRGMPTAALVPVIAAGLCYGLRGGILTGVLSFPANSLLLVLCGVDWPERLLGGGGIAGTIALVVQGALVGRLRDLDSSLRSARNTIQLEIDERTQSYNELKKAEGKLSAIIKNSPDAIYISENTEGRIDRANNAFLDLLGYRTEEIEGTRIADLSPHPGSTYDCTTGEKVTIDDTYLEHLMEQLHLFFEKGVITNWEFYLVDKQGTLVPVESNVVSLLDDRQERIGDVGIIRDITRRRQEEATLRETYAFLDNIIESSIDCIVISDGTGKIIRANTSFLNLMGWNKADLPGKATSDFSPFCYETYRCTTGETITIGDDYFEGMHEQLTRMFEEGSVSNWEAYFLRSDKMLVPVEQNSTILYNPQKEIIGAVGIIHDITMRRVAENRLHEANEFLDNIIESSLDCIAVSDKNGRITRVNRALLELLRYDSPDDLIGRLPSAFAVDDEGVYETTTGDLVTVGRDYFRKSVDSTNRLFAEGHISNLEFYFKRRDGILVPIEENIVLLTDKQGERTGAVGIIRDITQRKQNELEMMRQRDQLEATNKELEAFSYSVSHDLRAPLRGIDGFSQAVIEDYGKLLPDEGRHYLERVRAASQRMALLIDDLLKLSRLTRREMHQEKIDLSALAREVFQNIQAADPHRQVHYSIQPGLSVKADKTLVRVLIDNLLGNAWKYTGKTKHPVIELGMTRNVTRPDVHPVSGKAVFFIRDNGVGFDMGYAEKLFSAFQRLHSPDDFPGTGIGLATAQRIVHRHGGTIWADAKPNEGATFYFTLQEEPSYGK